MKLQTSSLHRLKKNPIVRGTMILTIGGILTRIIGFFFRIFLSHTIGAEGIGIYQLIFPVQLICYSLCTSGFELAISKLVATKSTSQTTCKETAGLSILKCGLILSAIISIIISVIVYKNHSLIANRFLFERRCEKLIMWLSLSIPLASIHSCICGYYLGLKKASVPAWSQFIEQCMRVLSIFLIVQILEEQGQPVTPEIAVIGSFIGEIFSVLFTIFSVSGHEHCKEPTSARDVFQYTKPIIFLATPVTLNRLMLSVMQSIQSILIPFCLMESGLSSSKALSLYGICLGMVIPLIMFPSSLIHSISMMLLPTIAEASSEHSLAAQDFNHPSSKEQLTENQYNSLHRTSLYTTRFSIFFGVYCTVLFVTFGKELGNLLFHNAQAGTYICILGFLCPFLYTTSTLASILNGLGKTSTTFAFSMISTFIQLACTILLIPQIGIVGYLLGMLLSSIINTILHFYMVQKYLDTRLGLFSYMLVPILITILLGIAICFINARLIFTSSLIHCIIIGLEAIIMTIGFAGGIWFSYSS